MMGRCNWALVITGTKTEEPCGPWTRWSSCSPTCGDGKRFRSRIDQNNCPQTQESEFCRESPCPEPCGPWTRWSSCSPTCGDGKRSRSRRDQNNCPRTQDSETCRQSPCPDPCGEWDRWSRCSVSCGTGTITRSRRNCPEQLESEQCVEPACIEPCGPWTRWSSCSATCGDVKRSRSRRDQNNCPQTQESEFCRESPCPDPCGEWAGWSRCSVTCGEGKRTRDRHNCPENQESEQCVEPACIKPCGPWTRWSSCSPTCGDRKRSRSRTDQNNCPQTQDSEICRQTPCPDPCGEWTGWSRCSVSCGKGKRTRDRRNCPENQESEQCVEPPCPDGGMAELFSCSFEQPCSALSDSDDDDFDWTIRSGSTQSGGTGPRNDHTLNNNNGVYLYVEASSPRKEDDMARLQTNVLSVTSQYVCLTFWYHMLGDDMGVLNIHITKDGTQSTVWTQNEEQGRDWHQAIVTISLAGTIEYVLSFEGIIGVHYGSDIAIDDVKLTPGKCSSGTTTTTPRTAGQVVFGCDFSDDICLTDISNSYSWRVTTGDAPFGDTGGHNPNQDAPQEAEHFFMVNFTCTACRANAVAISRLIQQHKLGKYCLKFSWGILGSNPGKLQIFTTSDDGELQAEIWMRRGNQGSQWKRTSLEFTPDNVDAFFLLFMASHEEDNGIGVFFLDNVNMSQGSCPGQLTKWSPWQSCSSTCGLGRKRRTRFCLNGPCTGENVEELSCNMRTCAEWGEWMLWGGCSLSCGGGSKRRTRTCSVSGECPGSDFDEKKCNMQKCPSLWSKWLPWQPCSASCGHNTTRRRIRICLLESGCEGRPTEAEPCNNRDCADWADWSSWHDCSVTCGRGIQKRTRVCLPTRSSGCEGYTSDTRECSSHACSEWAEWSVWTHCSRSCGGGTKERTRLCTNESSCPGDHRQGEICNNVTCGRFLWNCTFDVDMCGMTDDSEDEFDWTRNKGTTQSSETGPKADHTSGEGYYIYTEASSPRRGNDRAIVHFPTLNDNGPVCLTFFYHMYGETMGSLTVVGHWLNTRQELWSKSENQGNQWIEAMVSIPANSTVYLEGTVGSDYMGDIALDDIHIKRGHCSDSWTPWSV